jgi:hypothetical protein
VVLALGHVFWGRILPLASYLYLCTPTFFGVGSCPLPLIYIYVRQWGRILPLASYLYLRQWGRILPLASYLYLCALIQIDKQLALARGFGSFLYVYVL